MINLKKYKLNKNKHHPIKSKNKIKEGLNQDKNKILVMEIITEMKEKGKRKRRRNAAEILHYK